MLDNQSLQREKYRNIKYIVLVITNLANLQTLNTYVFSATCKQQISQDHITNRHSSKIYPVGVEQQNFQVQKEFYKIHLNQQN